MASDTRCAGPIWTLSGPGAGGYPTRWDGRESSAFTSVDGAPVDLKAWPGRRPKAYSWYDGLAYLGFDMRWIPLAWMYHVRLSYGLKLTVWRGKNWPHESGMLLLLALEWQDLQQLSIYSTRK
eukprot:350920-Amorphochlora_amoeboformis.AAC.1